MIEAEGYMKGTEGWGFSENIPDYNNLTPPLKGLKGIWLAGYIYRQDWHGVYEKVKKCEKRKKRRGVVR